MKRIPILIPSLSLALLGLLAGCGDSLDVTGAESTGTVGGVLVDSVSRAPLEGVDVSLVAGGRSFDPVTTDSGGTFRFTSVPAGEVLVGIASPDGYRPAWIREELPNAAGQFPSSNATLTLGPIGLVALSERFSLRVLDLQGRPVPQYSVGLLSFVEYIDFSTGSGVGRGESLTQVTTDVDGNAVFAAFPDYYAMGPGVSSNIVVLLPPRDAEGDGIFEYSGGDRLFNMRALADPTPDVILDAGYTTALTVRASTISRWVAGAPAGAEAVLGINDSIHVAFSLPISDAEVVLTDEDGVVTAPAPTLTYYQDAIEIGFAAPLAPGREYNLSLHATSTLGERNLSIDLGAPFFTRGVAEVTVTSKTRDINTLVLEFSEPIGGTGTLAGGNCVVYVDADLDGLGAVGDTNGELGHPTCSIMMSPVEPNPPGVVTASGYTRYWSMTLPTVGLGVPLPSGTQLHLLFENAESAAARMKYADGTAVPSFTGARAIAIP